MSAARRTFDAVSIGGGIAGLSVALHLADRGLSVAVVERATIASGSTGQASGLIGQLRSTPETTRMMMDSVEILRRMEERDGSRVFSATGGLRLATTPARAEELARHIAVARAAGLGVEEVSPAAAAADWPFARFDDALAAANVPTDGYLNPPELAALYARLCRAAGVAFFETSPVEAIETAAGRVSGVVAGELALSAPVVVNAAGPWSGGVAGAARASIPTAAIGHMYFTTAPAAGPLADPAFPTLRDREALIYARPTREGALRVGIYETEPVGYDMAALGPGFRMGEMKVDPDHPTARRLAEASRRRFPAIGPDAPLEFKAGIMTFTPDGFPLLGPSAELPGLFHATGFCGHGMTQSGVVGAIVSELIVDGSWRHSPETIAAARFEDAEFASRPEEVRARCEKVYSDYYAALDLPPA